MKIRSILALLSCPLIISCLLDTIIVPGLREDVQSSPFLVLVSTFRFQIVTIAMTIGVVSSRGPSIVHMEFPSDRPNYFVIAGITSSYIFILNVFTGFILSFFKLLGDPIHPGWEIVGRVMFPIFAVFVAPIAEEIYYRGYLYDALDRVFGELFAVAVSSLVFGMVHAPGPPQLMAGLTGLVLCWSRVSSKSLWPGVLAHAFTNIVGLILQSRFV